MKKFLKPIMLVAMAASFTLEFCSCNRGGGSQDAYVFVKEDSDSEWGLIDSQGKVVFGEEFKYVPQYLGMNLMAVEEGDGYEIYGIGQKPKAISNSQEFQDIGIFNDTHVAPAVVKGERIRVINTEAETVFTLDPVNGKEITTCYNGFSSGLLAIQNEEGHWGFVNQEGSIVIKCKYKAVLPFIGGRAAALNQNDRVVIIDTKGEEVLKIKEGYELADFNPYGILVRSEEKRYAFIDKNGDYNKLPSSVSQVVGFNNDYIIFSKSEGDFGVMNREGEVLIRPKYSSIAFVNDGKYFLVEHNDKYSLIDKNDEKIADYEDYKHLYPINDKDMLFMAYDGTYYMVVDKNGKPINKKEYRDISVALVTPQYGRLFDQINSEYANVPGIVAKLSDMITTNGIEGFSPDATIKESMILQKRGTYSFYPENSEAEVYGCKFKTYVEGYRPLYLSSYSYYSGYSDSFNTDNKVEFIRIDCTLTRLSSWKDVRSEFKSMIESKGFKLVDSESNGPDIFNNSKVKLVLSGSGSNMYVQVSAL